MAHPANNHGSITDLVPSGAYSFPISNPKDTRWFTFLLLPEFTLLAFSAALDPLRIANQLAQKPLYGWRIVSENGMAVTSSSGVNVSVHGDLSAIAQSHQLLVCSGNNGTQVASARTLSAVRRHMRFGGKAGGVCTGASTLARAGVLQGRTFTLHWENQLGFTEAFPSLAPTSSRYEIDRDISTCGGGTAATEMMICKIAGDYGQDFGAAVSDMCLNGSDVSTRTEQRSSIGKVINSRNPKVLMALRAMYNNIEDPVPLEELAKSVGVSRRQLERQFVQLLGESPAKSYRNIKLERARSLLAETDLSVMQVAMATGFNSVALLSRHFRERYGETPYGHRGKSRLGRKS